MLFHTVVPSPIGELLLVSSATGLLTLALPSAETPVTPPTHSHEAPDHPVLRQCVAELSEYFAQKRKHFTVPLEPKGTAFQELVWSSLLAIPYGTTWSYSQQAEHVANKNSVRAVAAANGRNPLPILIPCHRVIAASGHLHGFAGGLEVKKKLLELEGFTMRNFQICT